MSEQHETAFAKINLSLHVREKGGDGYHRIETYFAFCEDGDRLTAEPAEPAEQLSLSVSGPFAKAIGEGENLVAKAAAALRSASGTTAGAAICLHKLLPVAAGIGGGSADAAATLRLLNRLWKLEWPDDRLEEVARGLGADVPACVRSLTMRGEGRGDKLEPVDLGLSGRPALLVNPRVEVSTARVFAGWDGIDRGPLDLWSHGRNDLEPAAKSLVPQIDHILAWLSAQPGAQRVRMSGSGATCFAFFESEDQCRDAAVAVPREWWCLATRLR